MPVLYNRFNFISVSLDFAPLKESFLLSVIHVSQALGTVGRGKMLGCFVVHWFLHFSLIFMT